MFVDTEAKTNKKLKLIFNKYFLKFYNLKEHCEMVSLVECYFDTIRELNWTKVQNYKHIGNG